MKSSMMRLVGNTMISALQTVEGLFTCDNRFGSSKRNQRKSRRRTGFRHESEMLETRVVMSASAVVSIAHPATPVAAAPSHVQNVLLPATTTNVAPSHVAQVMTNTIVATDPNDQISEAVNMGTITTPRSESGSIDSPTDVDMFRVAVSAGQRLSFDVDVSGRLDSYIRLFNSAGQQLAINDDGAAPGEARSLESYLEYTFTSGGNYYLGVSGYRNSTYNPITGSGDTNGSTGDYELTVRSISNSPADPAVMRFDTENNNSFSQANFIGVFNRGYSSQTYYGSTGAGSDTQDWTQFRLDGRTTGTIQISGMFQDLDLELYNASGIRIARSANSGTRTDTINLNDLAAGTYYVRVMPGISGARSAYAMRFGLSVV